ncbi:protein of unknown function (DUF4291) domain containing protein [Naviculisporaceae sp. PSN 640]
MSTSNLEATAPSVPYKQIRALYDAETITVYQAYSAEIANAAVQAQKLNASPKFRVDSRMTWIKPSWGWMLYRAGYSYKDKGQERILALRMRHGDFLALLRGGVLTTHAPSTNNTELATTTVSGGTNLAVEEEDANVSVSAPAFGSADGDVDGAGTGTEGKVKGRGRGRDKSKSERPKSETVKVQWDPERSVRLERLDYRSIQIGIPGCLTKQWCEEMIVGIEDVTDKARELKRVLDADKKIEVEELIELGLVPVEREFEVPGDIRRLLGMDLPGGEPEPRQDRE